MYVYCWYGGRRPTHYVYSPDTRLFYKRALRQHITGNGKLFDCPAFVHTIHIDAAAVTSRKDDPRVWFEYKQGYEFLAEADSGKMSAVTVQSFSTELAEVKTPARKKRRPSAQTTDNETANTPMPTERKRNQRGERQNRAGSSQGPETDNTGETEGVARTLYDTPASRRRHNDNDEALINQFIDTVGNSDKHTVEQELFTQVMNSGKKRAPSDPRASSSKVGEQVR